MKKNVSVFRLLGKLGSAADLRNVRLGSFRLFSWQQVSLSLSGGDFGSVCKSKDVGMVVLCMPWTSVCHWTKRRKAFQFSSLEILTSFAKDPFKNNLKFLLSLLLCQ